MFHPRVKKPEINLVYDPLNPYLTNWPRSFLKIGFNLGIHANEIQDGVPVLRLKKLREKVVLPPIYKVKYNRFAEKKNNNIDDDASLVCSRVAQRLFNKTTPNFKRNKSKNSFSSHLNIRDN